LIRTLLVIGFFLFLDEQYEKREFAAPNVSDESISF